MRNGNQPAQKYSIADIVLHIVGIGSAITCTIQSIQFSFFSDPIAPITIPFTMISLGGVIAAIIGWIKNRPLTAGIGLAIQLVTPLGFDWVICLIPTIVGITLIIQELKQRNNRKANKN